MDIEAVKVRVATQASVIHNIIPSFSFCYDEWNEFEWKEAVSVACLGWHCGSPQQGVEHF